MADSCCTHLHDLDDVHRWLPSDILGDIGIIDPTERRRLAVVEDLAARLASILGSATVERTQNNYHVVPPYRMANSHQQRHHSRMADAPLFTSNSSRPVLGQAVALPRFAPAPPAMRPPRPAFATCAAPPLNRSGSGGTGVFLPRTKAYRGAEATARPAGGDDNNAGVKQTPPHHCRRQQQCRSSRHAGAATMSRQQLHHLHAHIAAEQPACTEKSRACAELALRREWVYYRVVSTSMHARSTCDQLLH